MPPAITTRRRKEACQRFEPMLRAWETTKQKQIASDRSKRPPQTFLHCDVLAELTIAGFDPNVTSFLTDDETEGPREDVPDGEHWGAVVADDEVIESLEFCLNRLWNAALGKHTSQPRLELKTAANSKGDLREEVRYQLERFRKYATPKKNSIRKRTPKFILVYDKNKPNEIEAHVVSKSQNTTQKAIRLSSFEMFVILNLLQQNIQSRFIQYSDFAKIDNVMSRKKVSEGTNEENSKYEAGEEEEDDESNRKPKPKCDYDGGRDESRPFLNKPLPKKLKDLYRKRIERFSGKCVAACYGQDKIKQFKPILDSTAKGVWAPQVPLYLLGEFLELKKKGKLPL